MSSPRPSPWRTSPAAVLTVAVLGLSVADVLAQAASPGPEQKVIYLSDIPGSTYEWLEGKQKEAYGTKRRPLNLDDLKRLPPLPTGPGWKDPGKLVDLATAGVQVPTRYQDLAAYILLNRVAKDVRDILPAEEARRVDLIDWGTLPTTEVNASARRLGQRYLVIFDEGVFRAVYALLLTIDRTVSFTEVGNQLAINFSPTALQEEIKKRPEILDNYVDLIVAFATGAQLPDIEFASDSEAANLMRQSNAIERFIVGHEFGHIVSSHTDARLVPLNANPARGVAYSFTRFGRDWITELEADRKGQQYAHEARREDESGLAPGANVFFDAVAAYAPALFLELMEALEDAHLCGSSGEGSSRVLSQDAMDEAFNEAKEVLAQGRRDAALTKVELGCRRTDHPPAWLRSKFVAARADAKFIKPPRVPSREIGYARSLLDNARTLAKLAAPRIKARLATAQTTAGR